jgi:hypothetical protein
MKKKNILLVFALIIIIFGLVLGLWYFLDSKSQNISPFAQKDLVATSVAETLSAFQSSSPSPSVKKIIKTLSPTPTIEATVSLESYLHDFMSDYGVSLTAKQVQYNMTNNVGKQFGLAGIAEICDYYNWGYNESIEDVAFCVHITPVGGYLESWHIYFFRNDFSRLYQDLLQGNVYVFVIAIIEPGLYNENQGNMASANYVEWFKY